VIETSAVCLMGWPAEGFVSLQYSYGEASSGEASGSRVATPPGVLCPASISLFAFVVAFALVICLLPDRWFWCANCVAALENVFRDAAKRSSMAVTAALSPSQFSPVVYGRLDVRSVLARS